MQVLFLYFPNKYHACTNKISSTILVSNACTVFVYSKKYHACYGPKLHRRGINNMNCLYRIALITLMLIILDTCVIFFFRIFRWKLHVWDFEVLVLWLSTFCCFRGIRWFFIRWASSWCLCTFPMCSLVLLLCFLWYGLSTLVHSLYRHCSTSLYNVRPLELELVASEVNIRGE